MRHQRAEREGGVRGQGGREGREPKTFKRKEEREKRYDGSLGRHRKPQCHKGKTTTTKSRAGTLLQHRVIIGKEGPRNRTTSTRPEKREEKRETEGGRRQPCKRGETQGKHRTQKPLALRGRIIRLDPGGGRIPDPFGGSRQLRHAASRTGRRYLGKERGKGISGPEHQEKGGRRRKHRKELPQEDKGYRDGGGRRKRLTSWG